MELARKGPEVAADMAFSASEVPVTGMEWSARAEEPGTASKEREGRVELPA